MNRPILYFFLLISLKLVAQDNEFMLSGTVKSGAISVENAHIINLNSNIGTVSNKKGYFEITVKLNDTLQISAISYKTSIIIIEKLQMKTKSLVVKLQIKVNELDEVIIDRQKITKGVNASVLQLPNAGKKPLDQNERKLNYYSQESVPIVILATLIGQRGGIDDIYNIISGNRKNHRKVKELLDADKLKEFNRKEIQKIRTHFKDDFFNDKLNLPKDKINIFIEYCLIKNVVELYNDNRYVEIIDVFVKEIDSFNLNATQIK